MDKKRLSIVILSSGLLCFVLLIALFHISPARYRENEVTKFTKIGEFSDLTKFTESKEVTLSTASKELEDTDFSMEYPSEISANFKSFDVTITNYKSDMYYCNIYADYGTILNQELTLSTEDSFSYNPPDNLFFDTITIKIYNRSAQLLGSYKLHMSLGVDKTNYNIFMINTNLNLTISSGSNKLYRNSLNVMRGFETIGLK